MQIIRTITARLAAALSATMIFPPSLFIALSTGASIALVSSCLLDGGPGAVSAVLSALAAVSFPLAYVSSLRVAAGRGAPFAERGAVRGLVLLSLGLACAAGTGARVHSLLAAEAAAPGGGRYAAPVEGVTEKRYYREVLARLDGGPGGAEGLVLARVSGGGPIACGDLLGFGGSPVPVRDPRCGPASYRRALLLEGVRYVVNLDGASVAVSRGKRSLRERARARLAERCDALFNRETAAIVKAFYFGNQDYIDKITMNDFKRAGVLHVLSASGLHVAIGFALSPHLRLAKYSRPYRLRPLRAHHSSRYS